MSLEQVAADVEMLKRRTRGIKSDGSSPSTGTLPTHTHAGGGQGGLIDAAPLTYTPDDVTDWTGSADPGGVADALDQLADRVTSSSHAPVTLAADADTLLGLTAQQLTLDSQNANKVFAGPTSGGAADPTFRSLVAADIPSIDAATVGYTPSDNTDWTGVADPGQVDDALDQLAQRLTDLGASVGTFTQRVVLAFPALGNNGGTATNRGATFTQQTRVLNCGLSSDVSVMTVWTVPGDWSSGAVTVKLHWATQGGAGNAVHRLNTLKLAAGTSITAAGTGNDTTTTPGQASGQEEAISIGSFTPGAVGELWRINVGRVGTDGADTLSASSDIIGIELQYTAKQTG